MFVCIVCIDRFKLSKNDRTGIYLHFDQLRISHSALCDFYRYFKKTIAALFLLGHGGVCVARGGYKMGRQEGGFGFLLQGGGEEELCAPRGRKGEGAEPIKSL